MDNTFLLNFYFKAIVQSERQDDFLASVLRCCVRTIDTLCRSVNVCLGATQSKPGKLRETILFFFQWSLLQRTAIVVSRA